VLLIEGTIKMDFLFFIYFFVLVKIVNLHRSFLS
jgi:hypothetical protein